MANKKILQKATISFLFVATIVTTVFISGCSIPINSITVTKQGTGSGTVVSSPEGIECGARCYAVFQRYSLVTLIATPDAGSMFSGWGGDCFGTEYRCTLNMTSNKTVIAYFNINDTIAPNLTVIHSPLDPRINQEMILNATAFDNVLVSTINIYMDNNRVQSCPINAVSGICIYRTNFTIGGNHTYYATAIDSSSNMGRDPSIGTKVFVVS